MNIHFGKLSQRCCASRASQYRCADGTAAIDLLRSPEHKIDVILLDITIPGASSHEVAAEAKQSRPDARVILTSAYSLEMVKPSIGATRMHGFIRKPYRLGVLFQSFARLLPRKQRVAGHSAQRSISEHFSRMTFKWRARHFKHCTNPLRGNSVVTTFFSPGLSGVGVRSPEADRFHPAAMRWLANQRLTAYAARGGRLPPGRNALAHKPAPYGVPVAEKAASFDLQILTNRPMRDS